MQEALPGGGGAAAITSPAFAKPVAASAAPTGTAAAAAAARAAVSFSEQLSRAMNPLDLHRTRVSQWYPAFRKATMATEVLPLPETFLSYMQASGPLVLPQCPAGMELHPTDPRFEAAPPDFDETGYHDRGSSDDDTWGGAGAEEGEEEEEQEEEEEHNDGDDAGSGSRAENRLAGHEKPGTPTATTNKGNTDTGRRGTQKLKVRLRTCFPDLEEDICKAIAKLGGQAFCRSDWTSPNDARWVCGSVKVTAPGHVFLLWKSSDALCAEVSDPWKYCERDVQGHNDVGAGTAAAAASSSAPPPHAEAGDPGAECGGGPQVLVLRRWVDLFPSMVFKCVVAHRQLLAVCQKDTSTKYDHLARRMDGYKVFHRKTVAKAFPAEHYMYDAYIDAGNRVSVLDFDPVSKFSDCGLFSAEELAALYERRRSAQAAGQGEAAAHVEARVCETSAIRPSSDVYHGLPKDLLDRGITATNEQSQKISDTVRGIMQQHQAADARLTTTGGGDHDRDRETESAFAAQQR